VPINELRLPATLCCLALGVMLTRCLLFGKNGRLPVFEHTPLALSKTTFLTGGGANSGALDAPIKNQDPDLAKITVVWPTLSEHIKTAILIMVKGASIQ